MCVMKMFKSVLSANGALLELRRSAVFKTIIDSRYLFLGLTRSLNLPDTHP